MITKECWVRLVLTLTFVLVCVGKAISANPPGPAPSFPAVDAEPLGAAPEGAIVLHAGWSLKETSSSLQDGVAVSRAGFDAKDWYATTVPTTVLGTLVRHGVYPDPYIGLNNLRIPDASDEQNKRYDLAKYSHLPDKSNPWTKPWWFRTEFAVPDSFTGKTVWLHFDGINYRADVWVNGTQIAHAKETVGMFRRFHYDVTKLVKPGAGNVLAVQIHPLDHPGDPTWHNASGGDGEITRDVTQYCSVGWDWVPPAPDRNMGIWQHVWLEATGPVAVRDPAAFTNVRLPRGEAADITVRCHLENASAQAETVDVTARIEPSGFSALSAEAKTRIVVPPGTSEIILTPKEFPSLVLEGPRLWWPVNYGDQPLYKLTVEANVGKLTSDRATSMVGVRTVETYILPSGGRAFKINGRPVRLTGGAWVPDFLSSWSAQRYRDEVRLMVEGNHTAVRINGCGIIAPDAFYAACDRYGLLVWQELSRTSISMDTKKEHGDNNDPQDCDPKVYLANMRDSIIRLRGHASLFFWGGSNESLPQENIGWPLENEILPALDGTRGWVPASHKNAPWSKVQNHMLSGGPWRMVRLPEYFGYYATNPDFVFRNEIGLASVPSLNSLAKALPDINRPDLRLAVPPAFWKGGDERLRLPKPDDYSLLPGSAAYHDTRLCFFWDTHAIMTADVGQPASLAELTAMADLYNNATYRAIFEAANKARPRNSGTLLWKTNATWPSFVWQVFDWYLRPNAGYYSMKSACKTLHVQHSVDDQSVQVVSTLAEARPGLKVRATLVDATGRMETTREYAVTAAADATTVVGQLPEVVNDERLHFLGLDLLDAGGRELDRTVTWVQAKCRWHELLKLPPAEVAVKVLERSHVADETFYRISVHNASAVPAVQVWVEVIRGAQGDEVLPAFWNDNALTLLPDERRELTVRFRTGLLGDAAPHLIVEGWNVYPHEQSVVDGKTIPLAMKVTSCEVRQEGDVTKLHIQATQQGPVGPRWTTWPVPVRVDGKIARYIRLGLRSGQAGSAVLTLVGLAAGEHRITVREKEAETRKYP